MPRITKAQLEQERVEMQAKVARLEKENSEMKRRISRGHDRSRSPRMPATSSQAHVDTTCKALHQVRLWQRDAILQEHREEIQRLQATVAKKDLQIASLRRGEGSIGEVLLNVYERRVVPLGDSQLDVWHAASLRRQTTPVHEFVNRLHQNLNDLSDVTLRGGTIWTPSTIPRMTL